ncbi:hypothetical protein ABNB59_17530 [Paenibacillus larvae]|uniref:Uncharacterized protein n=3 Tax=Paenibacillus larvae TaxID=1464 RepID=V9W056_9BACL|nr:hypothetical protein [Paenibacillus larvae]AHD04266.1 hypothetical protein ERIC2_c04100 [Paenibacillus larvae subsp. larvae DSM 25430]AQR79050.1 hypothetical protein BXP28_19230 [Paenibacillus larvae subsp. larvae]AVF23853.1 hypothetical protein ERICI_04129 [Paenibacillus larvae subsp. larvae]AVG10872.1 hypothetical protein ERICII_00423 [Paenibacillus larvae subsp. larvae DSM 25430]ETK29479.1 hypothetical protein ERIC1_1c30310 [Paenibacillus larvae subsp. larvae DSM 25719]
MLFVRELTNQEGQHLLRVARRNTSGFAVRRAYILLASAQKMKVKEIASLYHCADGRVICVDGFGPLESGLTRARIGGKKRNPIVLRCF